MATSKPKLSALNLNYAPGRFPRGHGFFIYIAISFLKTVI
jgi:hypothetical protein